MAKKLKKKKSVKRMVVLLPATLVLLVVLVTTIGKYWIEIVNKYQENVELNNQLDNLKEEEATLAVDVEKLQDPDYIARYAREKYMFSKDGEIVFRLPSSLDNTTE